MRDSNGRFLRGYDKDRHVFTQEESKKGYETLCERMGLKHVCGSHTAKRYAFMTMCKTESIRYNNPAIAVTVTKYVPKPVYNSDGSIRK